MYNLRDLLVIIWKYDTRTGLDNVIDFEKTTGFKYIKIAYYMCISLFFDIFYVLLIIVFTPRFDFETYEILSRVLI